MNLERIGKALKEGYELTLRASTDHLSVFAHLDPPSQDWRYNRASSHMAAGSTPQVALDRLEAYLGRFYD